jgi:hypothetical protein
MILFLRNLFFQDALLKLFSLTLAVLIWLTVSFAIQREVSLAPMAERTFFGLPVLVVSSAEDVRLAKVTPKEVEVTVQGDPKALQNLQPKDIRVIVDLTGIESARYLQKRIEVSTPAGVTHSRVIPSEVQVAFPGR